MPLSWRHYVVGTVALGRLEAQQAIREHTAGFMANARKEDRTKWMAIQQIAAGWR